ncbi:MAG: DASH family cryptochrome [Flavobacterium sp.]
MKHLVWFQNNLRVEDNEALFLASQKKMPVVGIYCLDPRLFENTKYGFKKTEKFRAKFLLETLTALKKSLAEINVPLFVFFDSAEQILPIFIEKYQITTVFAEEVWTFEENETLKSVQSKTKAQWKLVFDNFLYHPKDIPFKDLATFPEVFTNFRKKTETVTKVRSCFPTPLFLKENLIENDTIIPKLADLGFDDFKTHPNSAFPFKGGTQEGLKRIDHYFFETQNLSVYKETRNGLIGTDYSSKLSAWLANGSLSSRMIYEKVKEYEDVIEQNESTYWLIFELIWRDFFKFIALKHGDKIFHANGILNLSYGKKISAKAFELWISGKTEEPFVNANMIELAKTGFMSNRGRQNVASFWAKNWQQDWRIAAAYFESLLIDYDVHSNYGNWLYVAGVGNDPRDRQFNVKRQATMYDPNGEYQDLWN